LRAIAKLPNEAKELWFFNTLDFWPTNEAKEGFAANGLSGLGQSGHRTS
jgi:hypothetical protein